MKKNASMLMFMLIWNVHLFIYFFEPPGLSAPSDRKVAGLLEWDSVSNTMDALAMMNHYQLKNESECPVNRFLKLFMHIT